MEVSRTCWLGWPRSVFFSEYLSAAPGPVLEPLRTSDQQVEESIHQAPWVGMEDEAGEGPGELPAGRGRFSAGDSERKSHGSRRERRGGLPDTDGKSQA